MDCMECEGRSRVLETERLHEMFHVKPKGDNKLTESVRKPVVVQVIPSNESVGYGRSLLDNDDYDFEY